MLPNCEYEPTSLNVACLAEKLTNSIVFGFTRSGLEPTIYRTRDEHADNYTTDAVFYYNEVNYKLCISKHINPTRF